MVVHSQLNSTAETMDIDPEVQRPETQNKTPTKPSWSDIPSIQDFLPTVLGYPLSGTPLRQAIRRRFADIEALLPVLQHIVEIMERRPIFDWMKAGQSIRMDRYGKVLRPRLHERNQRGKRVEKEGVTFSILRTQAGHPPLETMISFLEAVLDTSFLSLMQHSEGRTLVASLEGIIRPELELTFHLGNICALLEPFAKTRRHDKSDKPGDGDAGPKQREPAARRTRENAVAIQFYQVEELEL